jgi:hypothetical protein
MTSIASSHAQPSKPALFARLKAWLAARPTAQQHRTTIDLEAASDNLKRDLGLDVMIQSERRW